MIAITYDICATCGCSDMWHRFEPPGCGGRGGHCRCPGFENISNRVDDVLTLKARVAELERQLAVEREITELFFVPDEEVLGIDSDELDVIIGEEAAPPTALETAIAQTEALLVSLRALHGRG